MRKFTFPGEDGGWDRTPILLIFLNWIREKMFFVNDIPPWQLISSINLQAKICIVGWKVFSMQIDACKIKCTPLQKLSANPFLLQIGTKMQIRDASKKNTIKVIKYVFESLPKKYKKVAHLMALSFLLRLKNKWYQSHVCEVSLVLPQKVALVSENYSDKISTNVNLQICFKYWNEL